ncbi:glycosyl hydrolase family 71-domain-containing protein [Auriculariales sp. MPI-PUGE-AT-0066]|nr:glycosyl hydrolase family 71-domain-containing protein [Auriculariales sp. MPI-PUGE-AT-0066]
MTCNVLRTTVLVGVEKTQNHAQWAELCPPDAFALNIDAQLNLAYGSAARIGMKVFISYDFNWWNVGQGSQIGSHLAGYAARPAHLIIDNKVFVSSFAGDGIDANALRNAVGRAVMWVPNYHPGQGNFNDVDGALNWMAWPNDGNNKAPKAGRNVTVEAGDASYISALGSKPYLAPVSPWFFTHYGPEVDYSKNWMFPSDTLWYDRWQHILALAPRFIEIVTWNDYGESHYIGPLNSKHQDDGGSKWTNDMPHNAWLDMAKPFIAAYKAGATSVNSYIQSDQIIYWYRPNLRGLNCDSTDTTANTPANNASGNYFMGRPDGWETALDNIYVVTLLKTAGTLTVSSGSNTQVFSAPAGAQIFAVPMGVGRQSFALARNGVNALAANSLKDVTSTCICGIYNFNAYTGSVPENFVDQAGPDALNRLVQGLKVQTCQPTPSLPVSAPPYTGPGGPGTTVTSSSSSSATSTSGSSTITTPRQRRQRRQRLRPRRAARPQVGLAVLLQLLNKSDPQTVLAPGVCGPALLVLILPIIAMDPAVAAGSTEDENEPAAKWGERQLSRITISCQFITRAAL